jgi:hypothetical protein
VTGPVPPPYSPPPFSRSVVNFFPAASCLLSC